MSGPGYRAARLHRAWRNVAHRKAGAGIQVPTTKKPMAALCVGLMLFAWALAPSLANSQESATLAPSPEGFVFNLSTDRSGVSAFTAFGGPCRTVGIDLMRGRLEGVAYGVEKGNFRARYDIELYAEMGALQVLPSLHPGQNYSLIAQEAERLYRTAVSDGSSDAEAYRRSSDWALCISRSHMQYVIAVENWWRANRGTLLIKVCEEWGRSWNEQDVADGSITREMLDVCLEHFGRTRSESLDTVSDPTGGHPTASSSGASQARDPRADYSNRFCTYFTQPEPNDPAEGRSHANGSWVAYGEWMYRCEGRRWKRMGPANGYADSARLRADVLER